MSAPENQPFRIICINCIYSVVFGCNIDSIVNPPEWDGDFGYVQWLGVDIAVQVNGKQLPEIARIHIRRCQNGFVGIYADSRVTVMVSQDPRKLVLLGSTFCAGRFCSSRSA